MSKFLFTTIMLCILSLQACNSNESKKEPIKESDKSENLSESIHGEIIPLADGGAYISSFTGTIWYLRGSEAVKVKEVSQLSSQTTSLLSTKRERALWTLLQHERSKRLKAESELESYTDNLDNSEAEDPY